MCKGGENAPPGSTLGTPALLHCSWFLQLLQSWNTGPAPTGPLGTPSLGLGTTKHRFSRSLFSLGLHQPGWKGSQGREDQAGNGVAGQGKPLPS